MERCRMPNYRFPLRQACSVLLLLAVTACGGGGGGSVNPNIFSADPSGIWHGTLTFEARRSSPSCPFSIGADANDRALKVSAEPSAASLAIAPTMPHILNFEGFESTADVLPGVVTYEGSEANPLLTIDFDSVERTAAEELRKSSGCVELGEKIYTYVTDFRPAENLMSVERTFHESCRLPSNEWIQCEISYEGIFTRR